MTELTRDAAIEVLPYNEDWPQQFEREKNRIAASLKPWIVGGIEHVGSTAVEGLAAKPIIDMMVGVSSLDDSMAAIPVVEALGYHYWPYKPHEMHWFCFPSPAIRTHHLHLVPFDSELWNARLLFRQTLRANHEVAASYATLKKNLARKFRNDREAYTMAKSEFIAQILKAESTASKRIDT